MREMGVPVFGFVRMTSVVVGAAVLAITLLNEYVGFGTGEDTLMQIPGYSLICDYPIGAGVLGIALVAGALLLPSAGGKKPSNWQ